MDKISTREELYDYICSIGLFNDGRPVYDDKHIKYISPIQASGIWQNPEELTDYLLYLKTLSFNSYLDIGTFNGYTTKIIYDYIKTHINPKIKFKTIDPFVCLNPEIVFGEGEYENITIEQITEPYDFVFIDGNHEYGFIKDFEYAVKNAKYAAFHDINDKYCQNVVNFWNTEVKPKYYHIEFKYSTNNFGIGVATLV